MEAREGREGLKRAAILKGFSSTFQLNPVVVTSAHRALHAVVKVSLWCRGFLAPELRILSKKTPRPERGSSNGRGPVRGNTGFAVNQRSSPAITSISR